MRGGERVLEEMVRLYPEADIFTHVLDREAMSPLLASCNITETFIGRLPGAKKHYQKYIGLMPRALEELDLRGYDLIISTESGPAKGVIAHPDATHVCYVNSPMRYIWDSYHEYRDGLGGPLGWLKRWYFTRLAYRLRQWDVTSAARVDHMVANSRFIASRINRTWGRTSTVVNPPVDLEQYKPGGENGAALPMSERGYYLFVSELVRYKRADLAIDAFAKLGLPLKVVGRGEEFETLKKRAPANVELLGRVDSDVLRDLYRGARALIFPGEEDFGIVPVEAMACGTPVIAYGRGGICDTVLPDETGLFFDEQTVESLSDAVRAFEDRRESFDTAAIAAQAQYFAPARFREELKAEIEAARLTSWKRRNAEPPYARATHSDAATDLKSA